MKDACIPPPFLIPNFWHKAFHKNICPQMNFFLYLLSFIVRKICSLFIPRRGQYN